MQHKSLRFGKGFRVAFGNRRGQAAEMVIEPGGSEGGTDNRHRGADQWLFVVSGDGNARVAGKQVTLRPGVLLLIEQDESHEIRNTGETPLKTLNFYAPPAFEEDGDPTPAGRA